MFISNIAGVQRAAIFVGHDTVTQLPENMRVHECLLAGARGGSQDWGATGPSKKNSVGVSVLVSHGCEQTVGYEAFMKMKGNIN